MSDEAVDRSSEVSNPEPPSDSADPSLAERLDEPDAAGDSEEPQADVEEEEELAQRRPATPFPVVGIGASAGGLEAFEQFFTEMPPDSGMALVLVQHLDPNHESMLVDLLQRYTRMPVHQVEDHTPVEPNQVYVIPPNRDMILREGQLELSPPAKPRGHRLPIDHFFRSLADDQQDRAICIVLSGTGSDGTLGLKAVKAAGGMAMVQEPASARYDGMPYSALTTGTADYVLPPEKMPEQLRRYVEHALIATDVEEEFSDEAETAMMRIFGLLQQATHHDFSQYKPNTIRRRILRRMAVHQIEELDGFVTFLRDNPSEIDALFHDLLISVTRFFRDPEAFEVLGHEVIPRIVAGLDQSEPVRVWVPGCATGEEAYSIAILIAEHLEQEQLDHEVQVFATDIDQQAIERAREGTYPDSIAADVPPLRLQRFFVQEGNTYRIQPRIRDMVVFAVQSLVADPPFSKLDLISCRNVLIYFGSSLQKRVVPLFHYALKPNGFLFLGSSETLGESTDRFEVVNRKWKIFTCSPDYPADRTPISFPQTQKVWEDEGEDQFWRDTHPGSMRKMTQLLLLRTYAPPSVIVNESGEILYLHGRTTPYLEPPTGAPVLNVLRMSREALRMPLTTALRKAVTRKEQIVRDGIQLRWNGEDKLVRLTVVPLLEPAGLRGLYMISFETMDMPSSKPVDVSEILDVDESADWTVRERQAARRIADLEQELRSTKEYLQTTVEELETSNEELQSTNEELQSSNEELQSTNEELETSQEELQSVNEELVTVNTELQTKIEALTQANTDISNLLNSIPVGVIFLDCSLNIERFNPPAKAVVNLIESDIGRPLGHLSTNLREDRLVAEARDVAEAEKSIEQAVEATDGRWYWMRIRPYRTLQGAVDGLVMTFSDITVQRQMQEELQQHHEHLEEMVKQRTTELEQTVDALNDSRERYKILVETSPDLIARFDRELRHLYVNPSIEQITGLTLDDYVGKTNAELDQPEELVGFWDKALTKVFETGERTSLEFSYTGADGRAHYLQTILAPELDRNGAVNSVISVGRDITDFEETQRALAASTARYRALFDGAENPILILDGDARFLMANSAAQRLFDQDHDLVGCSLAEVAPDAATVFGTQIDQVLETHDAVQFTSRLDLPDGEKWYSVLAQPLEDVPEWEHAVQMIAYDITDIKRAEEIMMQQQEQLRTIVESLPAGAVYQEGSRVWVNQAVERITGYSRAELSTAEAWFTKLYGDAAQERLHEHQMHIDSGFPETATLRIRTKSGKQRWVEFAGVNVNDTIHLSVMHDVTERYEATAKLEEALADLTTALNEKETLLRELYHRTKNNMQVISAIIDFQAHNVHDEEALTAFQEIKTRINSIALVHQKLYESKTLSSVDLADYITDLSHLLMNSYRLQDGVKIDLDLEPCEVDIDTALPCGLLVNELVANALKHAFPEGRKGTITIGLKREEAVVVLRVTDDGVGVPDGYNFRQTPSLGMQTVYALGEHQLQGRVTFSGGPGRGTTCEVRFPIDVYPSNF